MTFQPQDGSAPSFDVKYFQEWITSLEGKLQPPTVPDSFVETCKLAETACKQMRDACAARDNPAIDAGKKKVFEAVPKCRAAAEEVLKHGDFCAFLDVGYNDDDWMTYVILQQAGAQQLADACQSGKEQQLRIINLLSSDLKREFLRAGGASDGQYARAVEIYHQLDKHLQEKANKHPTLNRLALAVALELCSPLLHFDSKTDYVDPIERFKHYEETFLEGMLDPLFSTFTVWELRHVVNCDATSEQLKWGRESLLNFRPNFACGPPGAQWNYCDIVRSDIPEKDPEWYKEPRSYDQILSGGGKCGPRAWYGRFICKTFGIPTWGVKQPHHAAMARWTANGWTTCFGAAIRYTNWDGRCGTHFELETKARKILGDELYRQKIMRLQWVAILRNQVKDHLVFMECLPSPNSPWLSLALIHSQILTESPPATTNQCSLDQGPTGEIKNKIQALIDAKPIAETISRDEAGVIHIPATCTSNPKGQTKQVLFLKSFGGGQQLMLSNVTIEYTIPKDVFTSNCDKYNISFRLCTVHRIEDALIIKIRCDDKPATEVSVDIPYTMGMWKETEPVTIETHGASTVILSCNRKSGKFSIAIKEVKLSPL